LGLAPRCDARPSSPVVKAVRIGRPRSFDHDEARQLHRQGIPVKALAARYTVSERAIRRAVGPTPHPHAFDHAEARRLYSEEGWGYYRIAKHFGVNPTSVRRVVKKQQVT
jgi:uncharacterized protein YjcR